jgi:hypothetical protein
MKFKLTLLALLAGASMMAQAASHTAAPAASGPTRAEVKKETAAANKGGALDTKDSDKTSTVQPAVKSDKSRADVKKQTATANKGGALDTKDSDTTSMVAKPAKSDKTRAEVKAETAAANKAGTIPNANTEGSTVKK